MTNAKSNLSVTCVVATLLALMGCRDGGLRQAREVETIPQLLVVSGGPTYDVPVVSAAATYAAHCASCHGAGGRGDGPAAYLVYPKPRDFTAGVFRFKSTPGTQPPIRDDIRRTITGGIERAAMPGFEGVFTEAQLAALADYVLAMNPDYDAAAEVTPLDIPAKPRFTAELASQGNTIYQVAGCAACHGDTGRGDGPSAATLVDAQGFVRPPADFATGVFKSGRRSEDLYRTIMIGVSDTPMPAHAGVFEKLPISSGPTADTDRAWAVVAYVESLTAESERRGSRGGAVLAAHALSDAALLADPWHAGWDNVSATAISVQPLWQRADAPRMVEVRVVKVKDKLAIALEWRDKSVDTGARSTHAFPDAVSAMFSLTETVPALTMGQNKPDGQGGVTPVATVNLWQWRADRQLNAIEKQLHDVAGIDEGTVADMYMYKSGDPVSGPIAEHDKTFIPAWAVGNPKSDPALMPRSVLESNAAGFGTLTLQSVDQQDVQGVGVWARGRWRVVMVRDLNTKNQGDVVVSSSKRIPVAFAVWDGSAGDRNGTKEVSGWHWLTVGD